MRQQRLFAALSFLVLGAILCVLPGRDVCAAAQEVFQENGDAWPVAPMSPDRSDDAYAIYSYIVEGHFPIDLMANRPQWLIADTTVIATEEWKPPREAIFPPLAQEQAFPAVLADYDQHKYERVRLEREFHLDITPYRLLSRAEVAEYQRLKEAADARQDNSMPLKYQGASGVIFFSNVYFNFDHTLALVYVAHWCGKTCGEMSWIVLAKINGGWEQLNWNALTGHP